MFKKITLGLILLSCLSFSQNYVGNLDFSRSPLSVQNVGEPYEFDLTFDFIGSQSPTSMGVGLIYYFITVVGDNSSFTNWPVSGHKSASSYENISNGFRYSFEQIQLKNEFPNYPSGNYKVLIMFYRGGNQWAFFGGYQNHLNNFTYNFDFNDFCSNCGNGIYYGHDNDGDGILEYYDDCPNEAGPSSNNGCPIPTGDPDLTIDKNNTTITSGCLSCNSVLANIGNDRYLLNPAQSMFLNISVKNQGTSSSVASNVRYFLSSNTTLGNTDIQFGEISNFSSMSPNSSRNVNPTFDYYTISGILNQTNGSSYILAVVDYDNFNPDEGDENNNVTAIPIRISSSTSSNLTFNLSSFKSNLNERPYIISVFNFQGQKVLSKEVNNITEERISTMNLSEGIYIIKSEKGNKKVYINKK